MKKSIKYIFDGEEKSKIEKTIVTRVWEFLSVSPFNNSDDVLFFF
jgi:hypothetical protein